MRCRLLVVALVAWGASVDASAAERAEDTYSVGVARVDITPSYNIRLSGFGFRRAESEGVTQKIWAKALAIEGADKKPFVLLTVDNLGIPYAMKEEVARRLKKKAEIDADRLAITATHTHTAPMLAGVVPTLFGQPIPKEHQERIDRYTKELTDYLEKVALEALKDRKPARLSWGIGTVGFAANRRTKGGPVDHDLPILVVRDLKGKVRAIYVTYACHCVTLSNNKISGDWAGYAQEQIETEFPGAIALVSIGCGADQNPTSGVTGDKVDAAKDQGLEIAREVRRLVQGFLAPVTGQPVARTKTIELPLADLPARADWEEKAKRDDAIGYHAKVNLARLDKGEKLRTKIDYPLQTWAFGDSLVMVFLPGEVVVDYALRLKQELDPMRVWINAYANDAPCYIPSERILKEGRYEGGGAMVYYDVPVPFKPGLEQKIVDTIHELAGKSFRSPIDFKKTESRPLSPQQSLATIRTKPDLKVELVVAEPLVVDPVAIDFGPDGKLWVVEMIDYPAGIKGDYQPGGRVRVVEDSDSDGQFDKATVFLDNIPFPTGVMVYRKGVLVCAAPDILYAEDTNGDGKADVMRKLYSGFGTDNFQARVNSLVWSLDGWIYGASGLYGGTIRCQALSGKEEPKTVALGNRDFRIRPDEGLLEPTSGRAQQGRVRDDWGNWFGCDNSNICWHYPLAEHYLRRNPYMIAPPAAVTVAESRAASQLFPLRKDIQRFPLTGEPGRPTAACGLGIYRDDLLGRQYTGNAFTCDPVYLIVHRLLLSPKGSSFTGKRAADEAESEFLGGTDRWFRPVQAVTGPDGALWIVDMYRYVIEHPRWIPEEELAKVDVRAGSTMGRIYRIVPKDGKTRPWLRLDKLDTAGLVKALDSPNGWQRDMASQMLIWRGDKEAIPLLEKVASRVQPELRLQALCVLDCMGELKEEIVKRSIRDGDPRVSRHVIRLAEKHPKQLVEAGQKRREHDDADWRLQVAFSLGEWRDERAGPALATLALQNGDDPYLIAAVLSSLNAENIATALDKVFEVRQDGSLLQRFLDLAVAFNDQKTLPRVLREIATTKNDRFAPWQLAALATVLESNERHGRPAKALEDKDLRAKLKPLLSHAADVAADRQTAEAERRTAILVLGRETANRDADRKVLAALLTPEESNAIQSAALNALARIPELAVAEMLTAGWKRFSPTLQTQVLDVLLSRPEWQAHLVQSLAKNEIAAGLLDAARRQRLLAHKDDKVRAQAAKLFAGSDANRKKVLEDYRESLTLKGDRAKGQSIYTKNCAACHRLNNEGHAVGPDLAALSSKTPEYFLQEILDPNRNVDSRYVEYRAVTQSGQVFTGLLASESASSITLRNQEGKEQSLLRREIDSLSSLGKSLMAEGMEKEISKQAMADLLAYLVTSVLRDAADVAKEILNDHLARDRRTALVGQYVDRAPEVLAALVRDLEPGTAEEYRRIPWIWRLTIAAGRRNDAEQIRQILDISLPKAGEPLRDWQAVVLGGGIVNGLSLEGLWPDDRLQEILKGRKELTERWAKMLPLAAAMADDEKVKTGTRYDALRLIALDSWEKRGDQLKKYLAKDVNAELQMGAISGLADMKTAPVAPLLLEGLAHFAGTNRELAVDALLRTDERVSTLLEGLEQGKVKVEMMSAKQKDALRSLKNEKLRARALKILE